MIEPEKEAPKDEEWIWVEGYKGTEKDMTCRGFQYKLGVQYDMPEDAEICACRSGFHLCRNLSDVFTYYDIGCGHRFFKVKALVRKKDWYTIIYDRDTYYGYSCDGYDKYVAKSIVFVSELTKDEILKDYMPEETPEQYKDIAIELSVETAANAYFTDTLVEDGYSLAFATYIVTNKRLGFDVAHAVGSMSDLSMDMKVLYILMGT